MKIRLGTFNCENLFMRYKFFYVLKGKKDNPYAQKYLRLEDIPTAELESYVQRDVLLSLFQTEKFLPDKPLKRNDGKKVTSSNLETLAKNGTSAKFDIEITPMENIYSQIVTQTLTSSQKEKFVKKLITFRVVAMKVNDALEEIKNQGGFLNSAETKLSYTGFSEEQRINTSKVFFANDPDIIALQEIENMASLKAFNEKYLDDKALKNNLGVEYDELNPAPKYRGKYPFMVLIDSHDPRMIDVAVLSRYPIISVRTHQFEKVKLDRWDWLFSRDCLEVEIALGDKNGTSLLADEHGKIIAYGTSDRTITPANIGDTITVFANHFKSRLGQDKSNPESSDAWKKRQKQAQRVIEIARERFGDPLSGNFVIAGDLNDGPQSGAVKPLLENTSLWNIVESAADGTWTHYYDQEDSTEQFDYLLISPSLKAKNSTAMPIIERRGLAKYSGSLIDIIKNGPRFRNVEKEDTEASDHCAVFADLEI